MQGEKPVMIHKNQECKKLYVVKFVYIDWKSS